MGWMNEWFVWMDIWMIEETNELMDTCQREEK